jgi:hypothetical protein
LQGGGFRWLDKLVNANKLDRGGAHQKFNAWLCKFQCIGEGWDSYFVNRGVGVRGNWLAKSNWGRALRFRSVTESI